MFSVDLSVANIVFDAYTILSEIGVSTPDLKAIVVLRLSLISPSF